MTGRQFADDSPAPHWAFRPLWGIGITSFVLGMIGLLLFAFPVLGVPISIAGLAFAVVGCVMAGFVHALSLRWSVVGLALSLFALGINVWMHFAPGRYEGRWKVPAMRTVPHRASVPPPSQFP